MLLLWLCLRLVCRSQLACGVCQRDLPQQRLQRRVRAGARQRQRARQRNQQQG
jgi:protein-tyrosine-phosphatase